MSPRTVAVSARQSVGMNSTGGQPSPFSAHGVRAKLIQRVEQTCDRPLAHSHYAVEPERTVASVTMAERKRSVVPCWRRNSSARAPESAGSALDDERPAGRRAIRSRAQLAQPSIITRVSSLSSAPVSVDVPSARAAPHERALVILFDPGGPHVA